MKHLAYSIRRALALLLISAAVLGVCAGSFAAVTINSTDRSFAIAFLKKLNSERASRGLSALTLDFKLCLPAKQRATECSYNDMSSAATAHTRPDGRNFGTVLTEYDVSGFTRALENLVITSDTSASINGIFGAWMNSTTGHREAMLDATANTMGIAYYVTSPGVTVAGQYYEDGCLFACMLLTEGYKAEEPYDQSGAVATPTPTLSLTTPSPSPAPGSTITPAPSTTPYMWNDPNATPSPSKTPVQTMTPVPSKTPVHTTPSPKPTQNPNAWTTAEPWGTVAPWEWDVVASPGETTPDGDTWQQPERRRFYPGEARFPQYYTYGPIHFDGKIQDEDFYWRKSCHMSK